MSRRGVFSAVAVATKCNNSNINAANFAWKYWRREYHGTSACLNQLLPNLPNVAGPQNDGRTTHPCKPMPMNDTGLLQRGFSSSPLLHVSSSTQLLRKPTGDSPTDLSVRLMSTNLNKSKVDFSTMGAMPHSTSASGNNNQSIKGDSKQPKEDEEMKSLSTAQKGRLLFNKYGAVFVGTYFGIYFATLGSFFVCLDFGLLDPDVLSQIFKVSKDMACETADIMGPPGTGSSMNEAANAYATEMNADMKQDRRTMVDIITGYLLSWDWTSEYAEKLSDNPHLANLALSWFIVKFTEPVRLAAAVIVTPKVADLLGQKEAKETDDTAK